MAEINTVYGFVAQDDTQFSVFYAMRLEANTSMGPLVVLPPDGPTACYAITLINNAQGTPAHFASGRLDIPKSSGSTHVRIRINPTNPPQPRPKYYGLLMDLSTADTTPVPAGVNVVSYAPYSNCKKHDDNIAKVQSIFKEDSGGPEYDQQIIKSSKAHNNETIHPFEATVKIGNSAGDWKTVDAGFIPMHETHWYEQSVSNTPARKTTIRSTGHPVTPPPRKFTISIHSLRKAFSDLLSSLKF